MAMIRHSSASASSNNMEAVDVDFTDLMRGTVEAAPATDKPKRGLERGNSDAKPPQAKARTPTPQELHNAQMEQAIAAATPLPPARAGEEAMSAKLDQIFAFMQSESQWVRERLKKVDEMEIKVDTMESRMTSMQTDMKDIKSDMAAQQTKTEALEQAIHDLHMQAHTENDKQWPKLTTAYSDTRKPLPANSNSNTNQNAAEYSGHDQLVIGGFPKDSPQDLRLRAAKMVWDKLPRTKHMFEQPVAIYEKARICLARKTATASWSAFQQAVEEYNS